MTKEEILAMEPGKTLDCIILIEVFDKAVTRMEDVLDFSTDISAAWQVVERMKEEYNDFILDYVAGYKGGQWSASVDKFHAPLAKTAEEAICKAALIAKYSTRTTLRR